MKTDISAILKSEDLQREGLIAILQRIQGEYGYLPAEALKEVAAVTGISLVDIYGTATFYRAFSLKPRGEHVVTICQGTACHVRGAPLIRAELEKRLGVETGETTEDGQFTLEAVNCLGACALAPIVVVDGAFWGHMTPGKVGALIDDIRAQEGLERDA